MGGKAYNNYIRIRKHGRGPWLIPPPPPIVPCSSVVVVGGPQGLSVIVGGQGLIFSRGPKFIISLCVITIAEDKDCVMPKLPQSLAPPTAPPLNKGQLSPIKTSPPLSQHPRSDDDEVGKYLISDMLCIIQLVPFCSNL